MAVAVVAVARGKKFTLTKLRGRCSLSLGVIGELTDLDICSLLLLVCRPCAFSISPFLTVHAVLLCPMHPAEKYFSRPPSTGQSLMHSSDWQSDRMSNSTPIACKLSRRSPHPRILPIPLTATRTNVMWRPSLIILIPAPKSFGRRMSILAHVTCWRLLAITCDYGACQMMV